MPLKKLSEGSKGGIKKGGVKRSSKPLKHLNLLVLH